MGILVVDDSEEQRAVLEAVLTAGGFKDVITADSAETALSIMGLAAPSAQHICRIDLVLLDIVMPGMDGFEACTRIRGEQRYAYLPVVVTTALDDLEGVANALKSGATDFLSKPLKHGDIIECMRLALKLKEELQRRNATDGVFFHRTSFRFECRDLKSWRDSVTTRWRHGENRAQ